MAEIPSSLHHYTSMAALSAMLSNALESRDDPPMLTLHASIGHSMNDRVEEKLFLDEFLTESELKQGYKETIDQITETEGDHFVVSFCKSNEKSQNYGDIPMWGMYGDGGRGAVLVFDYKKLKEHCDKEGIRLEHCQYLKSTELEEKIKEANGRTKGLQDEELKDELRKLLSDSFTYKDWHWGYEDEYRLIVQSKDACFKNGKYGLTAYCKIAVPLSCVKSIIVGPLALQDVAEKNLSMILQSIKERDNSCDIKIKNSKLQIR